MKAKRDINAADIGKVCCTGPMWQGVYVGDRLELQGKIGIVRQDAVNPEKVGVQMDDHDTGLHLGWHSFWSTDFSELS